MRGQVVEKGKRQINQTLARYFHTKCPSTESIWSPRGRAPGRLTTHQPGSRLHCRRRPETVPAAQEKRHPRGCLRQAGAPSGVTVTSAQANVGGGPEQRAKRTEPTRLRSQLQRNGSCLFYMSFSSLKRTQMSRMHEGRPAGHPLVWELPVTSVCAGRALGPQLDARGTQALGGTLSSPGGAATQSCDQCCCPRGATPAVRMSKDLVFSGKGRQPTLRTLSQLPKAPKEEQSQAHSVSS